MIKLFGHLSLPDVTCVRFQAHTLHLIVCNDLGLCVKQKKTVTTSDNTDTTDPEECLGQSLKKVNIIVDQDSDVSECASDDSDNETGKDESDVHVR